MLLTNILFTIFFFMLSLGLAAFTTWLIRTVLLIRSLKHLNKATNFSDFDGTEITKP